MPQKRGAGVLVHLVVKAFCTESAIFIGLGVLSSRIGQSTPVRRYSLCQRIPSYFAQSSNCGHRAAQGLLFKAAASCKLHVATLRAGVGLLIPGLVPRQHACRFHATQALCVGGRVSCVHCLSGYFIRVGTHHRASL